jgi:hypothetical protein
VILARSLLVLAIGCGSSEAVANRETTPAPRVRVELADALPADASVVGRVDVGRLRASPRWEEISSLLERVLSSLADGDEEQGLARIGMALLPRVDELAFALTETEAGTAPLVIARGTFEEGELRSALAALDPNVRAASADGVTEYRAGAIAAAEIGDVWIVGALDRVARASLVLRGRAQPAALESQALAAMFAQTRAGGAQVSAAALPTDQARSVLRQLLRADQGVLASVRSIGVTGRLDEGLHASVLVETGDVVSAGALSESASEQLDELAGNVMLAMFGVRELVQAIRVEAREGTAVATIDLDGGATSRLVNRFGGAIVLLVQAYREEQAQARDAAPPSPVLQLDE